MDLTRRSQLDEQERRTLHLLLRLELGGWRQYPPAPLPGSVRQLLENADVATLQSLLAEVVWQLQRRGEGPGSAYADQLQPPSAPRS